MVTISNGPAFNMTLWTEYNFLVTMCGYTAFFTPVKCPMKLTLNFELKSWVYVNAHPLHMGTALVKIERDCRKTKYTLDKEYVLILTFELQSLVKGHCMSSTYGLCIGEDWVTLGLWERIFSLDKC